MLSDYDAEPDSISKQKIKDKWFYVHSFRHQAPAAVTRRFKDEYFTDDATWGTPKKPLAWLPPDNRFQNFGQGSYNDCYLAAPLNAVMTEPELLDQYTLLNKEQELEKLGFYKVMVYSEGKATCVLVSKKLPINRRGEPKGFKCSNSRLPLYSEKAYLKSQGKAYDTDGGGYPSDGALAFACGSGHRLFVTDETTVEEVYDFIQTAVLNKRLVFAASEERRHGKMGNWRVSCSHAYQVLKASCVKLPVANEPNLERDACLVTMFCPWAVDKFKTIIRPGSRIWKQLNDATKEVLCLNAAGRFVVEIDEAVDFFANFTVHHYKLPIYQSWGLNWKEPIFKTGTWTQEEKSSEFETMVVAGTRFFASLLKVGENSSGTSIRVRLYNADSMQLLECSDSDYTQEVGVWHTFTKKTAVLVYCTGQFTKSEQRFLLRMFKEQEVSEEVRAEEDDLKIVRQYQRQ